MQEGLLPRCEIVPEVCTYNPFGRGLDAEILTGGFPCQARFICYLPKNIQLKHFLWPGRELCRATERIGRPKIQASQSTFPGLWWDAFWARDQVIFGMAIISCASFFYHLLGKPFSSRMCMLCYQKTGVPKASGFHHQGRNFQSHVSCVLLAGR